MTKYAEKEDSQYDELVEQIDANRESIRNVKLFWRRFAIACFTFVAVLSTYICVSGANLWEKNIEVNKLYEADVAKLLTQLGEANAEKEALNEKLRAQSVIVERTRQHEFHGRQDHAKEVADLREKLWTLAHSTRAFIHGYHDPEQMTDHLHNARAWWTYTNLKDRMSREQIELGSNLILHVYSCFAMIQDWDADEPLAED